MVVSNDTWLFDGLDVSNCLRAEAVESLALTLKGVDNVKGGDGLATSMLSVADGILDDVLKEGLEDTAGFFVHQARDALDATTTCQTADRGLRDALDVVTEDLAMTLGTTFAALTSLSATRHSKHSDQL